MNPILWISSAIALSITVFLLMAKRATQRKPLPIRVRIEPSEHIPVRVKVID